MARTANKDAPQRVETLSLEEFVDPVNGLTNTTIFELAGVKYTGQPLVNQFLNSTSVTDLVTGTTVYPYNRRITGSGIWDLDSNHTLMVIKSHIYIYIYSYTTGVAPTLITTLTCDAANSEVYLETVYGSTEKASITGFTKYVFLNLPGEAWVVAYNTRIGNWQAAKLSNTYSTWASATNYSLGHRRIPTVSNGYYYEVYADAGSSGATEPTWPTTIGDTVVDSGITWICRGRYAGFPTTTSSSVQILDGYIFVCVGGDIYNSDLDLPDSWPTSNFISTETNPDNLVAIAKYKNYLVAFGTNTIEFFYDAANTNGSPLARQEGVQHNIGCIGQSAVTQLEDRIFWIAQSGSTYYSVWELDNFKVKKISSSEFDKELTKAFLASTTTFPEITKLIYIFLTRIGGRLFLGIPDLLSVSSGTPATIPWVYFLDLELNIVSKCLITGDSNYFSRPFIWKSIYLWTTSYFSFPSTYYVSFSILSVDTYDYSFINNSNLTASFSNSSSVTTKRFPFKSNNYKVLNELQINVYPGVTIGSGSWSILRDQEISGANLIPVGGYRTTRCGRAREFVSTFTGNYSISSITFKYTEHNN